MSLGLTFRAAARSSGVALAMLSLMVLSMVYTLLSMSTLYARSAASLASSLLKPSEGLTISPECRGDCIARICWATATARGGRRAVILVVPVNKSRLLPTPSRGVIVGRLVAEELGVSKGESLTLKVGGQALSYKVSGIQYGPGILALAIIAPGASRLCNSTMGYRVGLHDPSRLALAVSLELQESLRLWRLVALAVLALASGVAGFKASSDLEGVAREMREQGVAPWRLTLSLGLLSTLSVALGYSYGVVLSHILGSLASSLTGAFIPPPLPGLHEAAADLATPALLAGASTGLAGARLWRG
jgi:hypothetical protein